VIKQPLGWRFSRGCGLLIMPRLGKVRNKDSDRQAPAPGDCAVGPAPAARRSRATTPSSTNVIDGTEARPQLPRALVVNPADPRRTACAIPNRHLVAHFSLPSRPPPGRGPSEPRHHPLHNNLVRLAPTTGGIGLQEVTGSWPIGEQIFCPRRPACPAGSSRPRSSARRGSRGDRASCQRLAGLRGPVPARATM